MTCDAPHDLLDNALALAGFGISIARCWGARRAVGLGMVCGCGPTCRTAGEHLISRSRNASTDPTILRAWRTARPGENLGALTGGRIGLVAIGTHTPHGEDAAVRRFGRLPSAAPISMSPTGALIRWMRWPRAPLVDRDALGGAVALYLAEDVIPVPGSRTGFGQHRWCRPPTGEFPFVPARWREAIRRGQPDDQGDCQYS